MTVQQRIYHYMKRLEEACDEAAVERLEMVPKRHYESLENCVQRCSDMIETLANKLPTEEKELRNDARIYLGALQTLLHSGMIRPYRTVDEQRLDNSKKMAEDYELSRPKRKKKMINYEWQPIETAPKDGTRIIVNDPKRTTKSYKTKVLVVFWHKEKNEWVSTMSNDWFFKPTHWVNLPEPPQ